MLAFLPSELRLRIYPYVLNDLTLSISWYYLPWQCSFCHHTHPISSILAIHADCEDAYQQSKTMLLISRAIRLELIPLVRTSFKTLCIPRALALTLPHCDGVYGFFDSLPTLKSNLTRLRVENGLQHYPPCDLFPTLDTITIHVGFVAAVGHEGEYSDAMFAESILRYSITQSGKLGHIRSCDWALSERKGRHLSERSMIRITVVGALLLVGSRLWSEHREGRWVRMCQDNAIQFTGNANASPDTPPQRYKVSIY